MSLTVWFAAIILNLFYFFENFLVHITPLSTPPLLISLIVVIEFTSQIIRPITLIVRLATNIITGHLILGLLSFKGLLRFLGQIPFMCLEIIVAIVQAFVFTQFLREYFFCYYGFSWITCNYWVSFFNLLFYFFF